MRLPALLRFRAAAAAAAAVWSVEHVSQLNVHGPRLLLHAGQPSGQSFSLSELARPCLCEAMHADPGGLGHAWAWAACGEMTPFCRWLRRLLMASGGLCLALQAGLKGKRWKKAPLPWQKAVPSFTEAWPLDGASSSQRSVAECLCCALGFEVAPLSRTLPTQRPEVRCDPDMMLG